MAPAMGQPDDRRPCCCATARFQLRFVGLADGFWKEAALKPSLPCHDHDCKLMAYVGRGHVDRDPERAFFVTNTHWSGQRASHWISVALSMHYD